MSDDVETGGRSPLVSDSYYHDGARWERDIYRRLELSRNAWRVVASLMGLALVAVLVALFMLIPLKSIEVVTLLVDKATGYVEVARPLESGGPISEREAVTQANIVRFIRARETYDPPALRDNFELASLLSAGDASKELSDQFSATNPNNPMKLWGATGRIKVYVKSVNFLTHGWMDNPKAPATAAVRFMTTRTNEREQIIEHWAANVRFRYTQEPMRNEWRFDNPLGFQVIEYRKDQETVAPLAGGASQ
ncbi:virB8 family protein [Methylocystis bryophila]|uniref:Type IV secretion system protein virB8 n=1 Tax=Methylocystis bryophila TaxID=655015 RepID=A0A1W6N248_9HYPH|nr:type IV secretion system protein [Methylocystis bryophila]ARN83940.1 type VI secretion protein [Methylocystis bryophila]BDV41059.1 type VI secretion protein [Methylocystis bryophila]